MSNKSKKSKAIDKLLNVMMVFFVLVFVGSAGYLAVYYYKIRTAESSFNDLKAYVSEDTADGSDDSSTFEGKEVVVDEVTSIHYVDFDGVLVQSRYASLYSKNSDFIGWLTIPDTVVDYPVMFTPEDEEFYLKRDFYKEHSSSGTLFLSVNSDPITPSDNVLIYGHNMKAGTMFHALLSYDSEDYYKEHKTIYFNTIKEDATYEVIAAFRIYIDDNDDSLFKYYQFNEAASEEKFNDYVSNCKALTPYEISETAEYGDKLITLSTCSYHRSNGRFVVVAKRVYSNGGESYDITSKAGGTTDTTEEATTEE